MSGISGYGYTDRQAFSALQQDLRRPVSASRIPLNYKAPNLKDGSPIPVRDLSIPVTGIKTIDKAAEKAASLNQFGEHAVRSVSQSTWKGGVYGAICGAAIVLVTQKNLLLSLFQLPWAIIKEKQPIGKALVNHIPWPFLGAALIIGGAGALMGSFLGFKQATKGSAEDLQKILQTRTGKKAKPPKENAHQY